MIPRNHRDSLQGILWNRFGIFEPNISKKKEATVRTLTNEIAENLIKEIDRQVEHLRQEDILPFWDQLYYVLGGVMSAITMKLQGISYRQCYRPNWIDNVFSYSYRQLPESYAYGRGGTDMLDHLMTRTNRYDGQKYNGKYHYESHPYHLNSNQILSIADGLKHHGVTIDIRADSQYFNGHTLRLVWKKNTKD